MNFPILIHIFLSSILFTSLAEGQDLTRRKRRNSRPQAPSEGQPQRYYAPNPLGGSPERPTAAPQAPYSPQSPQHAPQPRYAPQQPQYFVPGPTMPPRQSPQPTPRNQNPYGQPANVPPHLKEREDLTGTQNWYGSTGSAFGFETISRYNPGSAECTADCKDTIEEPRWALQLQGAVGWGPIKRNNISFTSHYRYTQNFRTNDEQAGRFGTWFKTFKASDFIFPTKDMLRSHELVTEIRYSMNPWQFGIHGMLDFERVGSSANFLGEPNEVADSVRNIEQIVPWIQWRIPGVYIATLYSPMRTEINKEDPRSSFTSWSLKRAGRGIFISAIQDNLFYLSSLSSTAGITLNWTNKKSASIQNDSTRMGLKASFDFPILMNIRAQPFVKYDVEKYILPRIKIDNLTDANAELLARSDSIFGMGGQAYLDLNKNWRFFFLFNRESLQSSLSDFSGSKTSYQGGLTFSWPLSRQVLRRLDRFSDSLTAEEN